VTISEEQYRVARERIAAAGLGDRVEILLRDYRDLGGRFDKIVSIEMFEALGYENWAGFFERCDALLAPDGIAVLQAISIPDHRFEEYRRHCDWLQRYIFPGSVLAATGFVCREMARSSSLGVHHLEDIGLHYAETLARWRRSFLAERSRVLALGFEKRFVRMWDYYLAVCEAAFATRTLGDLQLVLTRPGNMRLPGIPAQRSVAA
jgi:cyclopropane-fatty-acyl-phospholipid synthase